VVLLLVCNLYCFDVADNVDMANDKTLQSISTSLSLTKILLHAVINLIVLADYLLIICSELTLLTIFHMYIQLFHFDVHEDVRTIADATIEKDEVHFLSSHRSYLFEIQVYNILKTGQMHVFLCVF
jgi:hypothetical protein